MKQSVRQNKFLLICAIIVSICIAIIFSTCYHFSSSVQKENIGFIHIPQQGKIYFDSNDQSTYDQYLKVLDSTIEPYETSRFVGNVIDCKKKEPGEGEVCGFFHSWLDHCGKNMLWGYKDNTPCVILTFRDNKEFDPVPYNSSDELHPGMPDSLKEKIRTSDNNMEMVWVYCENAVGYYPLQGFQKRFFPIKSDKGYLPPLIAVDFDLEGKDELDVKCTLYSKGSEFDTHFSIGKKKH